MPAVFFARIAKKVYGPFDADKLKKLADAGRLTRDDAISKDGKTGWTLAGNVRGLFPPAELLVPDSPRPIETVIRREPSAVARPAPTPAVPIPQAMPAPPAAQPTIVYMHAPAAPAAQQNVQTTVIVNAARPHNTCATLAAGLGLLSLIAAFVPVLGLIVVPAAGLTLLLALFGFIIALTRGGTGLVGSLGGGLLAVIAIPIAAVSTVAGVGGAIQTVNQASQAAEQSMPPAAESQPAEPATAAPASAVAPGSEESPKENPEESETAKPLARERAKLADLEAELESNRQKIEISRANHAKVESDLAKRVEMGKRKPDDLLRAKTHTEEFEQRSARLLAKLTADVAAQKQIVAQAGGGVVP